MIVVFARENNERAADFRERLLAEGIPCARADRQTIATAVPFDLIVTYESELGALRETPYDVCPTVAIGNRPGSYPDEDAVSRRIILGDSLLYSRALRLEFMKRPFILRNSQCVPLTTAEYLMYAYLKAVSYRDVFVKLSALRMYCYPRNNVPTEASSVTAISRLNRKCMAKTGQPAVLPKRYRGYRYIEESSPIDVPELYKYSYK